MAHRIQVWIRNRFTLKPIIFMRMFRGCDHDVLGQGGQTFSLTTYFRTKVAKVQVGCGRISWVKATYFWIIWKKQNKKYRLHPLASSTSSLAVSTSTLLTYRFSFSLLLLCFSKWQNYVRALNLKMLLLHNLFPLLSLTPHKLLHHLHLFISWWFFGLYDHAPYISCVLLHSIKLSQRTLHESQT